MAQHGYLREYDEGWDRGDDQDRERERGWRDEDRDQSRRVGREEWSERDRGWREDRGSGDRSGNFMLGERERDWDRGARGGDDHSKGIGDRAQSWFRDDDREYRGTHQDQWSRSDRDRSAGYGGGQAYGGFQRDRGSPQSGQRGFEGRSDWNRSPRNFSSHQDDHYRSWRDRQMSALDRDYEDYCREREQQFHSDFDNWRRNRQDSSQTGQQQAGNGAQESSEEVMELSSRADQSLQPQSVSSPTAEATVGTNNSENSGTGRGTV